MKKRWFQKAKLTNIAHSIDGNIICCPKCSTLTTTVHHGQPTTRVPLTDDPKGLSGLMTLVMKTLMMFSSLSCSGSGDPPRRASP